MTHCTGNDTNSNHWANTLQKRLMLNIDQNKAKTFNPCSILLKRSRLRWTFLFLNGKLYEKASLWKTRICLHCCVGNCGCLFFIQITPMYWEATRFYNEYKGKKCKYGTYLTRLWKWMSRDSAIKQIDYHCFGLKDEKWCTCPRCFEYKDYSQFYSSKSEKNGKDNVCSDCRKRAAKFAWENNPSYKQRQQARRAKLKLILST